MRAVFVLLLLAGAHSSVADTFTSSSYQMQTPVMLPGGYGSSTSFRLLGVIDIMGLASSSSSSFALRPGFLAYPFASSPVVTATAGSGQVALSWTAATGYVGWTASGYSVGKATASGGPYTFADVGDVLSSTQSSLTNGTAYYFVVRVLDAFSNVIATSSEASATPVAASSRGRRRRCRRRRRLNRIFLRAGVPQQHRDFAQRRAGGGFDRGRRGRKLSTITRQYFCRQLYFFCL